MNCEAITKRKVEESLSKRINFVPIKNNNRHNNPILSILSFN